MLLIRFDSGAFEQSMKAVHSQDGASCSRAYDSSETESGTASDFKEEPEHLILAPEEAYFLAFGLGKD